MRWLLVLTVAALTACGGDAKRPDGPGDAGPGIDAPPRVDAGTGTGSDAGALAYCLDKPDQIVPTPPIHGLPCDLVPPSLR